MAVKLLTVESASILDDGLQVLPGVPMDEVTGHPELRQLRSDGPVELRLPDGSVRRTHLVRFGVSMFRNDDGSFYIPAGENGPRFTMLFTLASDLRPEDVPPGTEIWVVALPPKGRIHPANPERQRRG